jgi:hypothetical protein
VARGGVGRHQWPVAGSERDDRTDRRPVTLHVVGPFRVRSAGSFARLAERGFELFQVGLATVTLDLRVVDSEADLAYEQTDGFFETMTTEFALDVALVGQVLDATVIKRQRRSELESQFDWLESGIGPG